MDLQVCNSKPNSKLFFSYKSEFVDKDGSKYLILSLSVFIFINYSKKRNGKTLEIFCTFQTTSPRLLMDKKFQHFGLTWLDILPGWR